MEEVQQDILDLFADMVYEDYIKNPILIGKVELTQNKKDNHKRVLEQWKYGNPDKYEKAVEILEQIQALAQNPEEIAEFEKRRSRSSYGKKISVLETLHLVAEEKKEAMMQKEAKEEQSQSQEQDFSQLEEEELIASKQLEPLSIALLKQRYGDKITLVEGRSVYYLEENTSSEESFVNDFGERIRIRPKGRLNYYDPVGVKEGIPCFEIRKEKMGSQQIEEIFSNIRFAELDDPEYARAVIEFLLSDENLANHNYGGYIGEIEKTALVQKNAIMIPSEPIQGWNLPRTSKYCIYYDPMALTAAKLLERQREHNKGKPVENHLAELEESGR